MSAGGDAKYGRLFTEADVLAIVDEAIGARWEYFDSLDAPDGDRMAAVLEVLIQRAEADKAPMAFPVDEPLFLLRGQDKAAPDAICTRDESVCTLDYYEAAHQAGADVQHLDAVSTATHRMREWQAAHSSRVKVPD